MHASASASMPAVPCPCPCPSSSSLGNAAIPASVAVRAYVLVPPPRRLACACPDSSESRRPQPGVFPAPPTPGRPPSPRRVRRPAPAHPRRYAAARSSPGRVSSSERGKKKQPMTAVAVITAKNTSSNAASKPTWHRRGTSRSVVPRRRPSTAGCQPDPRQRAAPIKGGTGGSGKDDETRERRPLATWSPAQCALSRCTCRRC